MNTLHYYICFNIKKKKQWTILNTHTHIISKKVTQNDKFCMIVCGDK